MRLAGVTVDTAGGFAESKKSYISADNMGFVLDALSTSFYRRPIEAIVQEYSNNGYDAEIAAGIENPAIKVVLNREQRTIAFVDHGTGMSPWVMENVFISFGESTKRGTDEQLGSMGFGGKSAFAYTDVLYIDTVVDGIQYEYMYSKSTDVAELDLLSTTETDKGNGTTMWFYLNPSTASYKDTEAEKFEKAVAKKLKFFDSVIVEGFELSNQYTIYRGKNFVIRDGNLSENGSMELCYGKNVYQLDWTALNRTPVNIACAVYFEIGELEIIKNREELRYTDSVIKLVNERIDAVIDEIRALYYKQITYETDLFQYLAQRKAKARLMLGNGFLPIDYIPGLESLRYEPIKDMHLKVPHDEVVFRNWHRRGIPRHSGNHREITATAAYYYSYKAYNPKKNSELHWGAESIVFRNVSPSFKWDVIEHFYDKEVLQRKVDTVKVLATSLISKREYYENVELVTWYNPLNIDWKKEISAFYKLVDDAIVERSLYGSYDDIEVPRQTREYAALQKHELNVHINNGTREHITFEQLAKRARYTIYALDREEYKLAFNLFKHADRMSVSARRRSRLPKDKALRQPALITFESLFQFVETPKKYLDQIKKLPGAMTVDQFFTGNLYKRLAYMWHENRLHETVLDDKYTIARFSKMDGKFLSSIRLRYSSSHFQYYMERALEVYPIARPVWMERVEALLLRYTSNKFYQRYKKFDSMYGGTNMLRYWANSEIRAMKLAKQLKQCQNK